MFSLHGYCDIYDDRTYEVWEVKRFSTAPSCQFVAAELQLDAYVSGHLATNPTQSLCKGGTHSQIDPYVFTKQDADRRGLYVIGYFDTGVGVVYYDYIYIPSPDEVAIAVAFTALAALAGYAGAAVLPAVALSLA